MGKKENTEIKETIKDDIQNLDKINRRSFFVTAGKLVIPTLGILGLGLSGFSSSAAADCSSMCSGECKGACTGCTGSCSGSCEWTCSSNCESSAKSKN
jgi:CXXX repeat radical SAM target protein